MSDGAEIMRFCRAWTDAIRDRDDDTMNQLMEDDFTFDSGVGVRLNSSRRRGAGISSGCSSRISS